jgi:hypothetical protein
MTKTPVDTAPTTGSGLPVPAPQNLRKNWISGMGYQKSLQNVSEPGADGLSSHWAEMNSRKISPSDRITCDGPDGPSPRAIHWRAFGPG